MTKQEILFRGFHPCKDGDTTIYVEEKAVNGRWIYGLPYKERLCGGIYKLKIQSDTETYNGSCLFEILPSTVCPYTGIVDKNDEKIFVRDRLDITDWANRDRTVEVLGFHNGVCWFGGDGFSDEYLFNSSNRLVIGTIFDKPKEATP